MKEIIFTNKDCFYLISKVTHGNPWKVNAHENCLFTFIISIHKPIKDTIKKNYH